MSYVGTSLAVQWLRFCAFSVGDMEWGSGGSRPVGSLVEELRSHMLP